jgi:hypothetical protein
LLILSNVSLWMPLIFLFLAVWVMSTIHILCLRGNIIQVQNCARSWSSMVYTLTKPYMNLLTLWKMECLFCVAKWLVFSRLIDGFILFVIVELSWMFVVDHTIVVVAMLLCLVVHLSKIFLSCMKILIHLCSL